MIHGIAMAASVLHLSTYRADSLLVNRHATDRGDVMKEIRSSNARSHLGNHHPMCGAVGAAATMSVATKRVCEQTTSPDHGQR
jgi:hypothetical protein